MLWYAWQRDILYAYTRTPVEDYILCRKNIIYSWVPTRRIILNIKRPLWNGGGGGGDFVEPSCRAGVRPVFGSV